MKLSTQTDLISERLSQEAAVTMIAEAGFDALDLSVFNNEASAWVFEPDFEPRMRGLRRLAESCGIEFNQAHAPFPPYVAGDNEYNETIRPKVIRAIEAAGIVGAKNIVVHPVYFPENKKERNLEMFRSFLPAAKRAGVKIALENMWGRDSRNKGIICNVCSTAEEFSDFVDALDPAWFTACLDIGHIGLVHEYEAPFIKAMGARRITCVHIHDNDYARDLHICPFTGRLPWPEIASAFAAIGYTGDITLEADHFLRKYLPNNLIPAGLRFMEAAGRELIRMIEEAKA